MITKNDCLSILVKMEDNGINIDSAMIKLMGSKEIPVEVLKFIADNRGIEVINFYDMLRKNHNKNKSPLYTNILKDDADLDHTLTTLTALLMQITLYSKKLPERTEFLKEVRAGEITKTLQEYFETEVPDKCYAMLQAVKTDLMVLEFISGRRELEQ